MRAEVVKRDIIEKLLNLESLEALKKIQSFVAETIRKGGQPEHAPDEEVTSSESLDFETWNQQFDDGADVDLDELLPDQGISLREYRRLIWEAERATPMSFDEFVKDQSSWRK